MHELRILREAYRVARATFSNAGEDERGDQRRALDADWHAIVQRFVLAALEAGDGEVPLWLEPTAEPTASRTTPLNRFRLRQRLQAVLWARLEGDDDAQILARLDVAADAAEATTILRCARLGRCVPENRTVLWLLWTELWLYPTLHARHHDRYDRRVVVEEFAVFAGDPMFWELVATDHCELTRRALLDEALRRLLHEAGALEDDAAVDQFAAVRATWLEQAVLPALLTQVAQGADLGHVLAARQSSKAPVSLAIPAFYLCVAERRSRRETLATLNAAHDRSVDAFLSALTRGVHR